jgi:hypothetical protein
MFISTKSNNTMMRDVTGLGARKKMKRREKNDPVVRIVPAVRICIRRWIHVSPDVQRHRARHSADGRLQGRAATPSGAIAARRICRRFENCHRNRDCRSRSRKLLHGARRCDVRHDFREYRRSRGSGIDRPKEFLSVHRASRCRPSMASPRIWTHALEIRRGTCPSPKVPGSVPMARRERGWPGKVLQELRILEKPG